MRQFLLNWRVEDGYLILEELPKKASKLWIEYDRDISETSTSMIFTNFIVNQKEYSIPDQIPSEAKIVNIWVD